MRVPQCLIACETQLCANALLRRLCIGVVLSIHYILVAYMATQNAPTVDEPAHLAAGVSYWSYGTFNLYPVNPPLAKLFASAPAFLLDARVNWKRVDLRAGVRSEWLVGTDFVEANAEQIFL